MRQTSDGQTCASHQERRGPSKRRSLRRLMRLPPLVGKGRSGLVVQGRRLIDLERASDGRRDDEHHALDPS